MSSSWEDFCLFLDLPDLFDSLSLSFLICAMGIMRNTVRNQCDHVSVCVKPSKPSPALMDAYGLNQKARSSGLQCVLLGPPSIFKYMNLLTTFQDWEIHIQS